MHKVTATSKRTKGILYASAIESVTQTLKEDPLFQQEEVGLEVDAAPTPRTAAAIASTAEAPELNECIEVSARPRATDDTKKPKNRKISKALTRACNPNDLKDLDLNIEGAEHFKKLPEDKNKIDRA